jgi:hypothetical protein
MFGAIHRRQHGHRQRETTAAIAGSVVAAEPGVGWRVESISAFRVTRARMFCDAMVVVAPRSARCRGCGGWSVLRGRRLIAARAVLRHWVDCTRRSQTIQNQAQQKEDIDGTARHDWSRLRPALATCNPAHALA